MAKIMPIRNQKKRKDQKEGKLELFARKKKPFQFACLCVQMLIRLKAGGL